MLENARPLPRDPCSGMPPLSLTAIGSLPYFSDGFASVPPSHPLHGAQPCHGEGAYITQWSYELLLCRVTQDGQVTVKSSDKVWSTGEENDNLLHYSCLENLMDSMKRQKVWCQRIHVWLNGHEFVETPGDSGGQRSLACYIPWSFKESAEI